MSYTAGQVMDKAASLMNDTAKTVYTYTAQFPYFNMALDELQEYFELHNVPITDQTSAVITVSVGTTQINPYPNPPNPAPNYPVDLVEIEQLWERLAGSSDSFTPMHQRDYLPHAIEGSPVESLIEWIWQDQRIKFIGALTAREVKLDYIKKLFPDEVQSANILIGIINGKPFLYYKTAALCTQFIGENPTRAEQLEIKAQLALDRVTGISTKGKQSISTRRRPFMAAYKSRGWV